MMWPFSFKAAYQINNSLYMDEDEKMSEQKLSGVEFHIFPRDYHTWVCPVFFWNLPFWKGRQGRLNGNQGQVPESILDTRHYMQGWCH